MVDRVDIIKQEVIMEKVGSIIFIDSTVKKTSVTMKIIEGTEKFVSKKIKELFINHVDDNFVLSDIERKSLYKDPEKFWNSFNHNGYNIMIQHPISSSNIIREECLACNKKVLRRKK